MVSKAITPIISFATAVLIDQTFYPLPSIYLKLAVSIGLYLAFRFVKLIYFYQVHPFYVSSLRHLPKPSLKPHWLYGHYFYSTQQPDFTFALDSVEENEGADLVRLFGLLNTERIVLSSTTALQEVLQSKCYTFVKPSFVVSALNGILGNGILFAEGETHKHQRKLLMPAFSFGHTKSLAPIFLDESNRLVKNFSNAIEKSGAEKTEIEVSTRLSALTLDIIYRAGLGIQFNALDNPENELAKAYSAVFKPLGAKAKLYFLLQSLFPWFRYVPINENITLWKGRQTIDKFAKDAITTKLEKYEQSKKQEKSTKLDVDILSVMIEEGKGSWTVDGMLDQLLTFLVAGHETTASSASLALHILSQHQDVQDKLREELYTRFPGGYSTIKTYDDIESLKYLNNVIREVLRYSPPVVSTARSASKDTEIAGQFIPKGTIIQIVPGVQNKLKSLWGEDAREFNPDRWNDRQAQNPYAFLTFIQGPRSCIGRRFSELEFKAILIALIGNFKYEPKPDFKVEFGNRITYRPKNGVPLLVSRLSGWE
ncbi:cytochrome P450 [Lipomyces japonicus]|uniref:cytochrome P450 n=1 Tax=Lipomyces japonicus TaxID=56871 RepID=UPI0034CEAF92